MSAEPFLLSTAIICMCVCTGCNHVYWPVGRHRRSAEPCNVKIYIHRQGHKANEQNLSCQSPGAWGIRVRIMVSEYTQYESYNACVLAIHHGASSVPYAEHYGCLPLFLSCFCFGPSRCFHDDAGPMALFARARLHGYIYAHTICGIQLRK